MRVIAVVPAVIAAVAVVQLSVVAVVPPVIGIQVRVAIVPVVAPTVVPAPVGTVVPVGLLGVLDFLFDLCKLGVRWSVGTHLLVLLLETLLELLVLRRQLGLHGICGLLGILSILGIVLTGLQGRDLCGACQFIMFTV